MTKCFTASSKTNQTSKPKYGLLRAQILKAWNFLFYVNLLAYLPKLSKVTGYLN